MTLLPLLQTPSLAAPSPEPIGAQSIEEPVEQEAAALGHEFHQQGDCQAEDPRGEVVLYPCSRRA